MNVEKRGLIGHRLKKDRDFRAAQLATSQNGLISFAQALARGFNPAAVDRRVRSGRWNRVYPGVYCLAGVPKSFEQELLAACLWAGDAAVASYTSAARLWKLDGVVEHAVEITVPRICNKSRASVAVHRSLLFTARDKTVVGGIPVTNVPRTLIDLAGVLETRELELALEDALRRRLVTLNWVWKRLRNLRGKGRHGVGALEAFLVERGPNTEITDSALEMRVAQAIREAGLPDPVRHFLVVDGDQFIGEVDFAYPQVKVAIEAEGRRYHDRLSTWNRERDRWTNLAIAGWRVLHVKWSDVTTHRHETIERLRRALTPLLSSIRN